MSQAASLLSKISEANVTLDNFDLKAVAKSLTNLCKSELKVNVQLETKIGTGRGGSYLSVSSNDINSQVGIKLFKSLTIEASQTYVSDGVLQVNLQYKFTSLTGGSNGLDIGVVWLNQDGSIKEKSMK